MRKAEAKRSFSALIKLTMESEWWRDKSPRYRADLEPVFQYLEDKAGKRDVSRMTQADIYEAMDRNLHRVRFCQLHRDCPFPVVQAGSAQALAHR